jgi:hypothetical protein
MLFLYNFQHCNKTWCRKCGQRVLIGKNKQKKIRQRYGKGKTRLEQSKICLHNVSAVMF